MTGRFALLSERTYHADVDESVIFEGNEMKFFTLDMDEVGVIKLWNYLLLLEERCFNF